MIKTTKEIRLMSEIIDRRQVKRFDGQKWVSLDELRKTIDDFKVKKCSSLKVFDKLGFGCCNTCDLLDELRDELFPSPKVLQTREGRAEANHNEVKEAIVGVEKLTSAKALPNDFVDVVCPVCKGRHKHKTTEDEIKKKCGELR